MDCVFCKIVEGTLPSKKVYEDDLILGIMDIDPFCDGHVLLIPKKHYTDMMELDSDVLKHINDVAKDLTKKLMTKLDKKSMAVSYNYRDKLVVKHFHLHLLPNIDDKPTHTVDEMYDSIMNN